MTGIELKICYGTDMNSIVCVLDQYKDYEFRVDGRGLGTVLFNMMDRAGFNVEKLKTSIVEWKL